MIDQKLKEAATLHEQGFNCAQAVGMPFAEELGMPKELAAKALEGFGAGMGSREQACGALSGAIFVAGLKNAAGNDSSTKQQTYALAKALGAEFEAQCGAIPCKTIKAEEKTTCTECIECGVRLACDLLR
ncbi:MAG: C_GCAxxG_C_C family protein [Clostridia bacterium]|nr:C_GCAxxG_C_C family protein [Clostridia bacterium]